MLLMCFCHTIAARYGALAGFGLSLAKWTLIVKRNTDLVRDENAWLWWLVLAFGFLICIRCRRIPMVVFSIVQTINLFFLIFSHLHLGAAGFRWLSSLSFKLKPVFQGNGSIPSNQALLAASLDASKGAALLLLLKKKLFCAFGQDSSRFLVFVNSLRIRSKRKELEIIRMLPPPTKHSPIVCIFCQN